MPKFKLITPPAVEPVLKDDLPKDQIRVSGTDEDDLIDSYIKAARRVAENHQNRALITQTWELYLDAFESDEILIEKSPVSGITSVKYFDTDNAEQTIDADDYELDSVSEPARLRPTSGNSWPSTYDKYNAVVIRFTAGYGTAGSDVPEETIDALLMMIAHFYENRGDEGHRALPRTVTDLLDMNRVFIHK